MACGNSTVAAERRRRRIGRFAVVVLAFSSPVWAQDDGKDPVVAPPALAQASVVQAFDIAPQSLGTALVRFSERTGIQLFLDSSVARGIQSPGVQGTMSRQEALNRLLAGSGLVYRFTNANTVAIEKPGATVVPGVQQLDPVQVQGVFSVPSQAMIDNVPPPYAGGQVATGGQLGLLGNRGVMDTPFNQTNYTAKKAQDQQAKTVRDVLIDDPSVRTLIADGMAGANGVRIRGFAANATGTSASYGGLYGILPSWSIMPELAERIELLKGPSTMLNGMTPGGIIGGTINVVPKRAPNEDLTQVTANYVSAGQFGGHADIARRFGDDKQFGVRFNGVYRAGQTEVQNNTDERALGIIGLDFRGEHVRLSADLGYQYQYIGGMLSYLGVNPGIPLPGAPNARTNQGQPWNYNQRKDLFGTVRGEVDLTERITAYAAFGAHDSRYGGLTSERVTVTGVDGTATASAPATQSNYFSFLTAEAGVRALVDTGPISHEFAATATTFEQVVGNGLTSVGASAFTTNIYTPTYIPRPGQPTPTAPKISTNGLSSLGFADTLSAAEKRIQLTAGFRLQNVTSQNFNAAGRATTGYNQSAVSPAVALIFKPWENVTVYGNWIQGLQPGSVVGPAFANAGEVFAPFKATQYEAGVKVDWGRFTTTASLFQISQPSLLTNATANTQFLGGEQVNQGLELNVFGEPIEGVRLLGGIMLLNAVLTKTQGGINDGWIAPFSPGLNLNLAGEWDLPFVRGLTLNGRVIYTGSQYIDTTYPRRSLPGWTRFDLGARYAFENPGAKGKLLVARFDVNNVLDTSYWETGAAAILLNVGAPRTFRVSLTADF
jgi:iron complex outermembrane receptor protein